jgi:hypothetical protein
VSRLIPFRQKDVEPAMNSPFFPELLSGNPTTLAWNLASSSDGVVTTGIWSATPGKWRMDYKVWEYCHILEGSCTITPARSCAYDFLRRGQLCLRTRLARHMGSHSSVEKELCGSHVIAPRHDRIDRDGVGQPDGRRTWISTAGSLLRDSSSNRKRCLACDISALYLVKTPVQRMRRVTD